MTKEIRRLRELAGLNAPNKYILNELFDSMYSYTWEINETGHPMAMFKTDDKSVVKVAFRTYKRNSVNVKFTRHKDGNFTNGGGHQFKILSTVMKAIEDFLKKAPKTEVIQIILFAEDDENNSKAELCRKIIPRFSEKNGFDFEENIDKANDSRFILTKKTTNKATSEDIREWSKSIENKHQIRNRRMNIHEEDVINSRLCKHSKTKKSMAHHKQTITEHKMARKYRDFKRKHKRFYFR